MFEKINWEEKILLILPQIRSKLNSMLENRKCILKKENKDHRSLLYITIKEPGRHLSLHEQIYNESIVVIGANKKDSAPINPTSPGNIVYRSLYIEAKQSQCPMEKNQNNSHSITTIPLLKC